MSEPLVSIICLCYNQAHFVEETLKSVLEQDYKNLEVIVIDDCSTDGSQNVIENFIVSNSVNQFTHHFLVNNIGNCKAFNQGLKNAKGKYVIDLSCDDVMLPNRISKQVDFFEGLDSNVGLIYSNTTYIDEAGHLLNTHFQFSGKLQPYSGNIYSELIQEYFIPTPTMMFKKSVLDKLNGYDEQLSYEDFDIWIRIAREHEIHYQNEVLTHTRKSSDSMSSTWYKQGDSQAYSTYMVCKKIQLLNTKLKMRI